MLLFGLVRRLVLLAAILAIPVVVGELVARKLLGDAVAHAVGARLGAPAHVSLGSGPVLAELVRGRLDGVTVRASGARLGAIGPVALTARLDDVHLTHLASLEGAIGSLTIGARIGPAGVRGLLSSAACADTLPGEVRAALTATPRVLIFAGRIDLLSPEGRAAEVRVRPIVRPNGLAFAVIGVERGGAPTTISAQLLCTRALTALPFGARLSAATATPGALDVTLRATNASFSALG